jgi:hypothetical protein
LTPVENSLSKGIAMPDEKKEGTQETKTFFWVSCSSG